MKTRIQAFDLLRMVAMLAILACHFSRAYGGFHKFDLAAGAVGNILFFFMSGWLLGIGWHAKGCPRFGISFLKHRFVRLLVPIWLFVIPYFAYLIYSGRSLSIKDIVFNLTLLHWFDRLPGLTAYWFVTAIAAFYLIVVGLSYLPHQVSRAKWLMPITTVGVVLVQFLLAAIDSNSGHIFILMLLGMGAFLYGDFLLGFVRQSSSGLKMTVLRGGGAVMLFSALWGGFACGIWRHGGSLAYWVALPAALASVGWAFSNSLGCGCRFVSYMSSISFEIFLVHQVVIGILVRNCPGNPLLVFILMTGVCIVLASILHFISEKILRLRILK